MIIDQSETVNQQAEANRTRKITNPTQSMWIDVFGVLTKLPYFESYLVPGSAVTGLLGLTVSFGWVLYQSQIATAPISDLTTLLPIMLGSAGLVGFGALYLELDDESECPECGKRFVYLYDEVEILDVTELEGRENIYHSEVTKVCESCGHSSVEQKEMGPEAIDRLRGKSS